MSGSISAGPYTVYPGTSLAPGQSEPVDVIVTDQVADGPWDVSLTLNSGLLKETYKARITFPKGPGMAAAALADRDEPSPVNWGVIAASAALVLLMVVTFVIIRSPRRRAGGNESGEDES
ncbi:hypothetical protein ACIPSA_04790 [Streptomyces sp. NPDC086549]|uniref:hypothetical protein n=1 Tax=Streptomyces sp. NPDC086549 TaxID=3365752 RepID=UPI0037F26093